MSANVGLRVIQGEFVGKVYAFDERTMCTIGRGEDCFLQMPNNPLYQDVSRHHCVLDIEPSGVRVRDLGSRNGTFVNGALIGRRLRDQDPEAANTREMPEYLLEDGDELRVGGTVFQVCLPAALHSHEHSASHSGQVLTEARPA